MRLKPVLFVVFFLGVVIALILSIPALEKGVNPAAQAAQSSTSATVSPSAAAASAPSNTPAGSPEITPSAITPANTQKGSPSPGAGSPSPSGAAASASGVRTTAWKNIPVLMYHSISTVSGNSLCVPEDQFREEMKWLSENHFHSISLNEFYQALTNGAALPENPILLTFDDGYSDAYTAAWPIMKTYRFTGTFFIITADIGNGYMTWDQIKELSKSGNCIASHTVHHLDLTTLSGKDLNSELKKRKVKTRGRIGHKSNGPLLSCGPLQSEYNGCYAGSRL